jgi:hypothetical protein
MKAKLLCGWVDWLILIWKYPAPVCFQLYALGLLETVGQCLRLQSRTESMKRTSAFVTKGGSPVLVAFKVKAEFISFSSQNVCGLSLALTSAGRRSQTCAQAAPSANPQSSSAAIFRNLKDGKIR